MLLARSFVLIYVFFFYNTLVTAQEATLPVVEQSPSKTETLETLVKERESSFEQLAELKKKLSQLPKGQDDTELKEQIAQVEATLNQRLEDFQRIASGVNQQPAEKADQAPQPLSVQQELQNILGPVLNSLRDVIKRPREISELQESIEQQNKRIKEADQALQNLQLVQTQLVQQKASPLLIEEVKEQIQTWRQRKSQAKDRSKVLQFEYDELTRSRGDFWSDLTLQLRDAVFKRGLNIFYAILAFFSVLIGFRTLYFVAMKYIPFRKYQRLNFAARLIDVMNQGMSVLCGIIAALFVLYARGDWLLGSLAILVLAGLVLATKSGITHYLEQVRMILNLGSVREGERVLIQGVPWRVGRINLFTQLNNPIIGNQGLRIPLEQLMQMTSRASCKDESWFPCKRGDWLLIDGVDLVKLHNITPEYVEIELRGNLKRWIPAGDFLKMNIMPLTQNFVITSTIGVDYSHQNEALTQIPTILANDIREGLLRSMDNSQLKSLSVEFKNAAASSLEFLIIATFTPDQAPNYNSLGRALQRLAVESCSRNQWSLPYPQLVIHRSPD